MSAGEAQLYFGGEILTLEESRPSAEAVAVRAGRILAVGKEEECRTTLAGDFEEVDLQGRVLLPGFIDTHLHPIMMAYFEMNADLSAVASIEELQARMRRAAGKGSEAGWVVGLRFGDEALEEPRLPTRNDLDAVCRERPVVVVRHDGHMVIGNTRAIEFAGIARGTENPEGGQIDREADGTPAGPFRENAVALLLGAMPAPDRYAQKILSYGCGAAEVAFIKTFLEMSIPVIEAGETLSPVTEAAIKWLEAKGMTTRYQSSDVDLGTRSVNASVDIYLPRSRWPLLLGGEQLVGPAVLFWSVIIIIMIVAFGLAKTGWTPLKIYHWFLLGIGISMSNLAAGLIVAGWLIALVPVY